MIWNARLGASLRGLTLGLAIMAAASLAAPAFAQDEGSPSEGDDVAESRATSFQAVSGPTREAMPGGPLLLCAYGAFVVMLLGYVVYLGRLQTTSARELARLGAILEAHAKDEPKAGGAPLE